MTSLKQQIKTSLTNVGIDTQGILRIARKLVGKSRFEEADLIKDFFKAGGLKNGVMIDVGAHFGESLSSYLLRGWTVFAFEPDPNPAKSAALTRLKSDRLKLFDLAIAEESGQLLPFYASDESTGISSLSAFTASHKLVKEVRTISLTDFIAEQNIAKIDFLKIDTEGHDLFVLKSYPWHIEALHPRVILCEFEDKKTKPLGYDYVALGNYLMQHGYAVFMSEWHPITAYGGTHQWRSISRFPASLSSAEGWGNFIAVKPDGLDAFLNIIKESESA